MSLSTGALSVNLKVLNVRGLPLTGKKPVTETSFLRCKRYNNRVKILCQHVYFQSHGFNQGKYCSQDNLEHITPSKEACTFASITMINISSKKKYITSKLCHMKVAKREIWSTFWICISAWNRLGARFSSRTSWTYQPLLPRFRTHHCHAHLYHFCTDTKK